MTNKRRKRRRSPHKQINKPQLLTRGKIKSGQKNCLHELCYFALSLMIVCLITATSVLLFMRVIRITDDSMKPEIDKQAIVLANRSNKPKRFDLISVEVGGRPVILRVIGLPGETVDYKNDQLFINGKEVEERHLAYQKSISNNQLLTTDFSLEDSIDDQQLPKKTYFLLGDNRSGATDSRELGFFTQNQIKGVVVYRIWPLTKLTQY